MNLDFYWGTDIWHQKNKANLPMNSTCPVSAVQANGVMVWGMFCGQTLDRLIPNNHCLNAAAYSSIVAAHVRPFIATIYLFSSLWMWEWVWCTSVVFSLTRSEFSEKPFGKLYGHSQHESAPEKWWFLDEVWPIRKIFILPFSLMAWTPVGVKDMNKKGWKIKVWVIADFMYVLSWSVIKFYGFLKKHD